jgi:undecaprenyl-diphosphatase
MVWSVVVSLAVAAALSASAYALVRFSQRTARRLDAAPVLRPMRAGLSWLTARMTAQLLVLIAGTALAFALAMVFVEVLDAVVENDDLTAIDRPAVEWIAAHRPGWLTPFVVSVTDLGSKVLLTLAVATAAVVAARRLGSVRPLLLALCALGGCALLVAGIKVVIGRARPDQPHQALAESGFAFPSGHSASALVGWALVAWLVCRLTANRTVWAAAWVSAALLTVAVGLSRIYLGVHYPSDVIGGWTLGAVWLTTVLIAWKLDPGPRSDRDRRPADPLLVRRFVTVLSMSAVAVLSATMGIVGTLAVTGWPRTPAVEEPGAAGRGDADPTAEAAVPHLTSAEARQIALDHAGDGTPTEVELEWEHGTLVWSVDVMRQSVEYDVDIDARTGTVISYGPDS